MALWVVLGVLVLVGTVTDLIGTTLSYSSPGGWLSRRALPRAWRTLRSVVRRRHGLLQLGGLGIVLSSLAGWLSSLVIGWWLILLGIGGVEVGSTGRPAGAGEVLAYVGVSFSTLGQGYFVAATPVARAVTVGVGLSGIMALTLLITYLTPVLSAVSARGRLAAAIHDLGATPHELRVHLWPGDDPAANSDLVRELAWELRHLTQMHHSYPVLHYFHSTDPRTALPPNLAALDDAAMLATEHRTAEPAALRLLVSGITGFLTVLGGHFVSPAIEPPPPADAPHGEQASAAGPDRAERRRLMRGYVEHDGWRWSDVTTPRAP